MKETFQFYMPDGTIESNTDPDHLKNLGMTDEFIKTRQQQKEAHLTSETYNERRWRNQQLRDALYLKQLAVVNNHVVEEYIQALKNYDLKYMPRPEFPDDSLLQAWEEWLV